MKELFPLHVAVRSTESPAVIEALLNGGADPNIRDESGSTPLYYASNPTVIEALLNGGADPNVRDGSGKTPCIERRF